MRILLLLLALSTAVFFSLDCSAYTPAAKKKKHKRHINSRLLMTFGPKAGLNMQEIYGGSTYEQAYKPGFTGGVFLSVNKRNHGIRSEALVNMGRINNYYESAHINITSFSLPMLYEVKIANRLWLQFGPQFSSIIMANSWGYGGNKVDVKNRFRNADVAAVVGAEVTLTRRFVIGARYIFGFVDVNNTSFNNAVPETWRNRGIQIYLGFRYF